MKLLIPVSAALTFASCSTPSTPNPNQKEVYKAVFVNPYQKGTYLHFRHSPEYSKTSRAYRNESVLAKTNGSNARIVIDLSNQRGRLYNGNEVAMDYAISSGKKKYPTPPGKYQVLEKLEKDKRSTLYGKIYDAEDNVVNSDATNGKDPIPEGGRFEGASMPYWMRISWDGIGMHRGRVPRYPASHGCIRTHSNSVSTVFSKVAKGTPVVVE
ncbi:L,D-transpeptidase [Persicirhabdus sediminis]|uniref:L,D-transpeptidase n=1 Tax=Persicirhabdus sediminis TaxID=454144 RepID=A0A8J7MEX7_9BACT|nr:L,D-transpeptidase [Persicirhabdus sediminis]